MGIMDGSFNDKRNLSYLLTSSMMNSAIQANVDALGHDTTFKLLTPYVKLNARWCVENSPRWISPETSDIKWALSLFNWWSYMPYRGHFKYRATEEGNLELQIENCRSRGAFPLQCEWFCARELPMMWEEIEPDHTMRMEKSMSRGDDHCLWLVRNKHGRIEFPELSSSYKTLATPSTSITFLDDLSRGGPTQFMTYATINLLDTIERDRAMKLLCRRARDVGRDLSCCYLSLDHSTIKDPTMDLLEFIDSLIDIEGRMNFENEGTIEKRINRCPFSGGMPEVCKQVEAIKFGALQIVSPNAAHNFQEEKGDDNSCCWKLKKDKTSRKVDVSSADNMDDQIKLLTNKFIIGEITEEELEKKMNALKRLGLLK